MHKYAEQYVRIIGVITWMCLGCFRAEAKEGAAGLVLHVIEPVEGYDSLFVHDLGPDGEVLGVAYNYDGGNALWMGPKEARKVFAQPDWIQLTLVRMNDAGMVLGVGGVRGVELPINNCYVWNPLTESTRIVSSGDKTFEPVDMNNRGEVSGTALWYVEGKKPPPSAGEGGEIPEEEKFYVDQIQAFVAGPSGIKYHGITETYEWEGGGGTRTGSFGASGLGLNSFGIVLGRQDSREESDIGVSWPGGERLGPDNGDRYYARHINDLNEAAGFHQEYDKEQERYVSLIPVLYKIGQQASVTLPLLPGTLGGEAVVLNDKGVVAGFCYREGKAIPVMWTRSGGDWKVESLESSFSGWIDIYLNRVGTNGSIVGMGMFEGEYRWFVLAPPALQIAVDANRDGTTRFAGDPEVEDDPTLSDETTPEKPFRFWLNDDSDEKGAALGERENGSRRSPNNENNQIDGARDLEDFSRLAIKLDPGWKTKFQKEGYRLELDTTGGLKIRLFHYPGNDQNLAETDYLTRNDWARLFTEGPFRPQAVNAKRLEQPLTDKDFENGKACFLWEGVNPGKGEFVVKLVDRSGNEKARSEVCVDIKPVWNLMQKGQAAMPAPYRFPYLNGAATPNPYLVPVGNFYPAIDESPHVITFVHGINMSDWDWRSFSETMYKRLWHAGYKGRFATFRWPSNTTNIQKSSTERDLSNALRYNEVEYLAYHCARPLREFLGQMPANYQNHVCAHSLGNVVTSESIRQGARVANYAAMQAAISAGCYDLSEAVFSEPLVRAENVRPTPQASSALGYRGFFMGLNVRLINCFNPVDFALRTGISDIGIGRVSVGIRTNYEASHADFKPDGLANFARAENGTKIDFIPNVPSRDSINRFYDFVSGRPGLWEQRRVGRWLVKPALLRLVVSPYESMAMVSRSVTHALGAVDDNARAGGAVKVSLPFAGFGLGRTRPDHSGQFERNIQEAMITTIDPVVPGLYSELINSLNINNRN